MPVMKIRDAEIHYEITGQGPPIVFISGMGGVGAYWSPQIEAFSRKYQVITFDQRGTGKSTRSQVKYTIEILAQDVIDLLDGLGIEKAHICGHSTGGMIAQVLAITNPERLRSIVLYGTRGRADDFTRRAMGLRRELLLNGQSELFVRSTALFLYPSDWIVQNQAFLRAQEDAAIINFTDPEIMASRIEAVLNHNQMDRLASIQTKALITCAKDDFLTPPYYSRELNSCIAGSILQMVEKGGHACSYTNPALFNEMVLGFFQDVD